MSLRERMSDDGATLALLEDAVRQSRVDETELVLAVVQRGVTRWIRRAR